MKKILLIIGMIVTGLISYVFGGLYAEKKFSAVEPEMAFESTDFTNISLAEKVDTMDELTDRYWTSFRDWDSMDDGVKNVTKISNNEICMGLFGVTSTPNMPGIENMIKWLNKKNPELYSSLKDYAESNEIFGRYDEFCLAVKSVDEMNHSQFFYDQIQYQDEFVSSVMKKDGIEWVNSRSSGLQGMVTWAINYAPYIGWSENLSDEKSDAENIFEIYLFFKDHFSTVGSMEPVIQDIAMVAFSRS